MVYEYKSKTIISILIVIILSFSMNNKLNKPHITPLKQHSATIVKIYNSSLIVNENGQRYYLMGIENNYVVGDEISFSANYKDNKDISSFNLFYRSTKAIGLGYPKSIKIDSHKDNFRNNTYNSLLEDNSMYSNFTLAMLYKTKTDENKELISNVNKLGVSHLLVISGFHISLFYLFVEKISKKAIKNKKYVDVISFSTILFFLYLVYFPPTGIRALLTIAIIRGSPLSRIDSLSLTGIFMFVINPYLMVCNSMILSFSITAMIYEITSYTKKETFLSIATISSAAFFLSIPTILT